MGVGLIAGWLADNAEGPAPGLGLGLLVVPVGVFVLLTGKLAARVFVALVAMLIAFVPFRPEPGSTSVAQESPAVEPGEPILTASARQLAIDGISNDPEVLDVALSQDGEVLNLVLVVNASTSESRAKELGDNFVRMVKTFSSDSPPGREIGRGSFAYLVGVYTPTETQIAIGAKDRTSTRITW